MTPLFTIGYEQATATAVLGELKRARVDLVVDTRAVAALRRPGFSKRQPAAALDEADIGYVHLQRLGTPAEGRRAAHAGDLDKLWRVYDKHIKTRRRRKRSTSCWRSSSRASALRLYAIAATRAAATAAGWWRRSRGAAASRSRT
jgi:uncharacterized protein (DUF488 family)